MFSAMLVLRFDLRPVHDKWSPPATAKSPMINALPIPDWDIDVELISRDDKAWTVSFSGYDRDMEIAAEDIESATSDIPH
jgi:hypothetical protein